MPSRHLSRVCAFQTIYEWDFRPKASIDSVINRNIEVHGKNKIEQSLVKQIVSGVIKNVDKLDAEIVKAAPEWPIEQISRIDKNILRLAIYELLNIDDVPPKVSIDEAVELAKTFGSENSSKFVNGVLGTVFRKNKKKIEKHVRPVK